MVCLFPDFSFQFTRRPIDFRPAIAIDAFALTLNHCHVLASHTERTLTNPLSIRLPAAAWYHYLRHGPEPSACSRWYRTRRHLQHLPQNQGPNPLLGCPSAHRIRAHELGHREVSSTRLYFPTAEDTTARDRCGKLNAVEKPLPVVSLYLICSPGCQSSQRIFWTAQNWILRLTYSPATSTSTPSRVAWSTPTTRSKRTDYIRGGPFLFLRTSKLD